MLVMPNVTPPAAPAAISRSYLVLASRAGRHVRLERHDVPTAFATCRRLRALGYHTRVMVPGTHTGAR